MSAKRVLIFDSGVGGLSVYEQIIKLNPSVQCTYLFDNAYFPYGELADDFLVQRLTALLAGFLNDQAMDLIVIACNSASTVALEALRSRFSIPIVGVVPAIKPATSVSDNGVIGLLATPATISRSYTDNLIEQFATDKTVLRIGSTELVQLAEDKLAGKTVCMNRLKQVLSSWQKKGPDTIVLGCTHFPLIKEEIAACFNHSVQLIDSGEAIAARVKQLLALDKECSTINDIRHQAFYTGSFAQIQNYEQLKNSFSGYGFVALSLCDY